MSTKNKSPSKSSDKNWKGSFMNLLSCGSGKKVPKEDQFSAPLTRSTNSASADMFDGQEGEINPEEVTVSATPGHGSNEDEEITYSDVKVIGKGTFGIVCRAKLCQTGEMVAIKKVFHDERFKNRELQMMRLLDHPNILNLRYYFYSRGERYKSNELYLNMVLDYMPETLYSVAQCDGTKKPLMDLLYVKVYMYQVFRSLAYLHALGICHRDIKPQNLLLNPDTCVIKLCDFGSAKELLKGEANIAYICSRYYRAPELVLGTTNYTQKIDVWSAGCVLGELLLGQPLFPGANGPDQLVEIIKILGTPSHDDVYEINPHYVDFRFPQLMPHPWNRVFKEQSDQDVMDLVSRVLIYSPSLRAQPIEACAHHFFDQLRHPRTRLPGGKPLPPLFNFTHEELSINPALNSRLMPAEGLPDSMEHFPADTPPVLESYKTPTSPTKTGFLGTLGGSVRSSLRGIAKSPSSSTKKKNKKKNGIEDDAEIPIPVRLDFSDPSRGGGIHDDEAHREHVTLTETENSVEIHLPRDGDGSGDTSPRGRPDILDDYMDQLDARGQHTGMEDHSIPHHYRAHLETADHFDDDLDALPAKMFAAEIDPSQGKKKKKKSKRAPVATSPTLTSDMERSMEAAMLQTSYIESDGTMSELGVARAVTPPSTAAVNTKSGTKPKKSRRPIASTPTEEPKSFEGSPATTPPPRAPNSQKKSSRGAKPPPQPYYEEDIEEQHLWPAPPTAAPPPPPPEEEDLTEVKVMKKKRPKVAKKPMTGAQGGRRAGGVEEEFSDGGAQLNSSRARSQSSHTEL